MYFLPSIVKVHDVSQFPGRHKCPISVTLELLVTQCGCRSVAEKQVFCQIWWELPSWITTLEDIASPSSFPLPHTLRKARTELWGNYCKDRGNYCEGHAVVGQRMAAGNASSGDQHMHALWWTTADQTLGLQHAQR